LKVIYWLECYLFYPEIPLISAHIAVAEVSTQLYMKKGRLLQSTG
jgi:hypothetical protein